MKNRESRPVKVIILTVPGSDRGDRLNEALALCKNVEIVKFEAIMFNKGMKVYRPNYEKQRVLYGRNLSDGEIGCAISHVMIQGMSYTESKPIVVLEDDARIIDVQRFEAIISEFIDRHGQDDAVMSLLPWNHKDSDSGRENGKDDIIKLIGSTPLTVGYVITPKAMESLSKANFDFSYLPDWPPTDTQFFITKNGFIQHGDEQTGSLIDQTGRVKTGKLRVMIRYSCLPYVLNRKLFSSFREYFKFAILPSITWRIDKIRIN